MIEANKQHYLGFISSWFSEMRGRKAASEHIPSQKKAFRDSVPVGLTLIGATKASGGGLSFLLVLGGGTVLLARLLAEVANQLS